MTEPLIIGVDPGLRVTGWALAQGRKCLDHGSIRLVKGAKDAAIEQAVSFRWRLSKLTSTWPRLCRGSIERYVYQGKARATNPDGPLVAELVGRLATDCDRSGVQTIVIPKNDALRACVPGHRCGLAPSEKEANAMLVQLYGVHLPNQHERDALMQCWAARQRWGAGR